MKRKNAEEEEKKGEKNDDDDDSEHSSLCDEEAVNRTWSKQLNHKARLLRGNLS